MLLSGWCRSNAFEIDGILVGQGRRMLDLTMTELLNFAYSLLVKDADSEGRRKVDLGLAGKLGESGGELVDDPDLPESMQGREAPAWWNGDHDPFADTHSINAEQR